MSLKKRLLYILALLVLALPLFSGLFVPQASNQVSAAGETYTWADYQTVSVTGSNFVSSPMNLIKHQSTLPGQPEQFGGHLQLKNPRCSETITLTLTSNSSGRLTLFTGPVISAPDSPPRCSFIESVMDEYHNKTVSISGTRPGDASSTEETQNQKNVAIRIHSHLPPDQSPGNITLSIEGPTTRNLSMPKGGSDESANYYATTTLEPGTYRACASAIIECVEFTKAKFQPLSVTFGESYGNRNIDVVVEITHLGGSTGIQSFELSLQRPDGTIVATTQTRPVEPSQTDTGLAPAVNIENTYYARGSFQDVDAGQYRVCITSINKCNDVTKEENRSAETTFRLTGAESAEVLAAANNPEGDESGEESCETRGGEMGWILCPVVRILDGAINWLDTQIQRLLEVDSTKYNNDDIRASWENIRNIAYIILVPAMLLMVISTALGFEFVSAYTVKRSLPRLVAAAVFITFSYSICVFMIQLFNALGAGILGLMTFPFGDEVSNLTLSSLFGPSLFQTFIFIPALGGLIIILWLFWIPLLLLAATAFFILLLRQMFIIGLLLMSPLAILAWVFPANTKLWSLWWNSFTKLLMMFPLIMGLIAMGRIFAYIIHTDRGGAIEGALLTPLMTLAAYMIPYAFIPFTFKLAGGMFATFTGMLNDKERGLFDRARKGRHEKMSRIPQGNALKGTNAFSRGANRLLQTGAAVPKAGIGGLVKPRTGIGRIRGAMGQSNAAALKSAQENAAFQQIMHDDDLLTAGLRGGSEADVRRHLAGLGQTGRELTQNTAAVMQARGALGSNFNAAAVVAKAGTGTGYNDVDANGNHIGHGLMMQDILRASGGDRNMERSLIAATKSSAAGARRYDLAGASFGASIAQIDQLRTGATDVAGVSQALQDSALDAQGAGAVLGGRADSVQALIPAIQRRTAQAVNNVAAAEATGNQQMIEQAQRELEQHMASTEALIDVAGQASPENARLLANGVHSQEIDLAALPAGARDWLATQPGGTRTTTPVMTVRQMMDHMGSRQAYNEMRRNYGSQYQQQVAQSAPGATPPPAGPAAGGPPANMGP
jgi:hypothetical protein